MTCAQLGSLQLAARLGPTLRGRPLGAARGRAFAVSLCPGAGVVCRAGDPIRVSRARFGCAGTRAGAFRPLTADGGAVRRGRQLSAIFRRSVTGAGVPVTRARQADAAFVDREARARGGRSGANPEGVRPLAVAHRSAFILCRERVARRGGAIAVRQALGPCASLARARRAVAINGARCRLTVAEVDVPLAAGLRGTAGGSGVRGTVELTDTHPRLPRAVRLVEAGIAVQRAAMRVSALAPPPGAARDVALARGRSVLRTIRNPAQTDGAEFAARGGTSRLTQGSAGTGFAPAARRREHIPAAARNRGAGRRAQLIFAAAHSAAALHVRHVPAAASPTLTHRPRAPLAGRGCPATLEDRSAGSARAAAQRNDSASQDYAIKPRFHELPRFTIPTPRRTLP